MRMLRVVALACAAGIAFASCARAQNAAFTEALKKNRGAIRVQDEKFAGPGADVLRAALVEAQFVALGEDHGIRQVSEFAAALCAELAPHGFHFMGLEIGAYVAPQLEKWRATRMVPGNWRNSKTSTPKPSRFTIGRKSLRCFRSAKTRLHRGI